MNIPSAIDRPGSENRWIGWALFWDLINGLALTFKYMFSRSVTMRYPDQEKWVPYERFKGHHLLRSDENGETLCVGCELCAKICPCYCITVVAYEDEKGNRRPKVFDVDTARCLFCGLCEDACPVECIAMGSFYEYSKYSMDQLVADRDQLMGMPGKINDGGYVADAIMDTADGVRVTATRKQDKSWWDRIHGQR